MDAALSKQMVVTYVQTALFFIVCIYGVCCLNNNSSLPPHAAYSALLSAIMGFLCAVLTIMFVFVNYRSIIPVYIFENIATAFVFLPGIITFHNVSLQQNSSTGKYLSYFGFAWAVVVAGAGQLLGILVGLEAHLGYSFSFILSTVQFAQFSNWGLVVVLIVSVMQHLNQFDKKARISILSYVFFLSFSVLVYTIVAFTVSVALTYHILLLIFVTVPTISAIVITFRYSHLWILASSEKSEYRNVEHISIQNDRTRPDAVTNEVNRPDAITNKINRPDAISNERSKPDVIEVGRIKPNAVN